MSRPALGPITLHDVIYLFRAILRMNSNYSLKHHYPADIFNEVLCSRWGTEWILELYFDELRLQGVKTGSDTRYEGGPCFNNILWKNETVPLQTYRNLEYKCKNMSGKPIFEPGTSRMQVPRVDATWTILVVGLSSTRSSRRGWEKRTWSEREASHLTPSSAHEVKNTLVASPCNA
jgi:hypothetical protein